MLNLNVFDCEQLCASNSNCMAFTFNNKNQACYLKSGGKIVLENPLATSGYKISIGRQLYQSNSIIIERADLSGGDYTDLKEVSFLDCIAACENNSKCKSFTYVRRQQYCALKSSIPNAIENRIAISGIKKELWEGRWTTSLELCSPQNISDNQPLQIDRFHISGYEFECDVNRIVTDGPSKMLGLKCAGEGIEYDDEVSLNMTGSSLNIKWKDRDQGELMKCPSSFDIQTSTQLIGISGSFPLASCKGWNGTIAGISGIDSADARMTGKVTRPDIVEYCERDPGGETIQYGGKSTLEQCVQKYVLETKDQKLTANANCGLAAVGYTSGNYSAKTSLPVVDTSCASGNPPLIEQFKLLCPTSAKSLALQ